MHERVDLFRYHDLTDRLGAFSLRAGGHVRGDSRDLQLDASRGGAGDGEIRLRPGESELLRFAGVVRLVGARSTRDADEPTLGLVMEGGATLVATSSRLVVLMQYGASQLGSVAGGEAHTFVFPYDLASFVSIPAKRSMADRIAGGRSIHISGLSTFIVLKIDPVKKIPAQVGGNHRRLSDSDVMRHLVDAAVAHRLAVSPPSEHERLQQVQAGHYDVDDGDYIAWLDNPRGNSSDVPAHLRGRIVEASNAGSGSAAAPPTSTAGVTVPPPSSAQPEPTAATVSAVALPPVAAAPVVQPAVGGWQRDPNERYAWRYWDGTQWTDRVADWTGAIAHDPA